MFGLLDRRQEVKDIFHLTFTVPTGCNVGTFTIEIFQHLGHQFQVFFFNSSYKTYFDKLFVMLLFGASTIQQLPLH